MSAAGRVAVVTGGAGEIGGACAFRLAEDGLDIVLTDIDEQRARPVLVGIVERGRRAIFCGGDVGDPRTHERSAQRALDEFGRLDVLVTAAGIPRLGYGAAGPTPQEVERKKRLQTDPALAVLEAPLEDWDAVLTVNLTGTLLAVRAAARRMSDGGAIVTFGSAEGEVPAGETPSYSVSKAGVRMLTMFCAQALAARGIRVNCVAPGFLDTNQTAATRAVPELAAAALSRIPLGRFGTADEVARVVGFLAGPAAGYLTGETVHVDGGMFTG